MRTSKRAGKVVVHVRTVSVMTGDVVPASAPAQPARQAPEASASSVRLEVLHRELATFIAQSHARAGLHALAGAASCGVAVAAGLLARNLEGHWLFTGLDVALLVPPAGYFFQAARKAEENARHFQALRGSVGRVLSRKAPGKPSGATSSGLAAALQEATFHATHATEVQCRSRTEILDILHQAGAAIVTTSLSDPMPGPGHLEFLGRVDPRHYVVRADGRERDLPRILYRMLLGMAARRRLFGEALPRGEDPGSYFRIGDRRDRVHELEAAFRELGLRILDEDGKGTKLRRIHCPPGGISIDAGVHLADPDIVEDREVRLLLEALAAGAASNVHPT